jgi:hypothetical protein
MSAVDGGPMRVVKPGGGRMAAVMDRLVVGARSSRDGKFNSLDAVDRQTRAASVALSARIESIIAANRPAQPERADADAPPGTERDARFDPEDEWELTDPSSRGTTRPAAGGAQPSSGFRQRPDDGDSEDHPPTWLR